MLAMIAITASCAACTLIYPRVQVGSNFRVKVEDDGRPVKGLRVEIGSYPGGNGAVTDHNGSVLFRDVRPGSYHLSVDQTAGIPDGVELEVKLDGPKEVTVPLKWPSVRVRSLKGMIRGPDYLPGLRQPRLSLDLLDGRSGRRLENLRTTERGEFDFESAAPGLYFLSLKPSGLRGWPGEPLTGRVAVTVDPGAPADHLDVDLGWTSCGLWYADQTKCPQSDVQIDQLSGQVLDPAGAAIGNATISLFDPAGTLVERLESNREGKFASPHPLAGTYQLVVSNAGFTPLRRTVHAKSIRNPTQALTVQLGLMGSCSAANLQ